MFSATSSSPIPDGANRDNKAASSLPSTNYRCNSCQISFEDGQAQRSHMKEPWHVCNVKRRIASQSPITLDEFNDLTENRARIVKPSSSDSRSGSNSDDEAFNNEEEQDASPFQCLFCSQGFTDNDDGFATNLEHMKIAHGMVIPEQDKVIDMPSFIEYLSTEVRVWHECLYCGATKSSVPSVQSHMKDKGHCRLNFDREPELTDFWDDQTWSTEMENEMAVSATELRLASGVVIGSRHTLTRAKKTSKPRDHAVLVTTDSPQEAEDAGLSLGRIESSTLASGRQLGRHEEMGVVGVPLQQRRALVLAEKKAQRSEAIARRAREWVYAQGANTPDYEQPSLRHGRQNHKLQPR